ncbi:MAG TPA: response regulator transcription factor [Micromonosporaceae bacterium]
MGDPVRVNVLAADPVLEAGATIALRSCPAIAVVAPDEPAMVSVVMVDAVDQDGLAVVRTARTATHRPEVVVVASDVGPIDIQHAIAAGACGLLRRRDATPKRLSHTVLAAAGGDCTVPPDVLDQLLADEPRSPGTRTAPELTDRERAVLNLIATGHETSEIAKALAYSTRTVTAVVQDITQRFRLRNRAHAVAYALRAGLL